MPGLRTGQFIRRQITRWRHLRTIKRMNRHDDDVWTFAGVDRVTVYPSDLLVTTLYTTELIQIDRVTAAEAEESREADSLTLIHVDDLGRATWKSSISLDPGEARKAAITLRELAEMRDRMIEVREKGDRSTTIWLTMLMLPLGLAVGAGAVVAFGIYGLMILPILMVVLLVGPEVPRVISVRSRSTSLSRSRDASGRGQPE